MLDGARNLWDRNWPVKGDGSGCGAPPAGVWVDSDEDDGKVNAMAGLRDRINGDLKDAMKAGDRLKISTLRLVNAAIKDRDIQNRTAGPDAGVSDAQILEVMVKMVKQRQESHATYAQAGRKDLADQEKGEIDIIQGYMPQQLTEDAMKAEIAKVVTELGAKGMKDMGRVMAALKERHAGRMDFAKAGPVVKSLLG